MKWNIITDSSCDMFGFEKEHENIVFSSVPFTISVGDENFVDDRNLDVDGMIDSMDACAEASHTACPSPHAWQEKFEQEGNVIAITISEQALRQLQQRVRRKKIWCSKSSPIRKLPLSTRAPRVGACSARQKNLRAYRVRHGL